jgi:hypothetical protein
MIKWIEKDGWLYDEQGSANASVYDHAPEYDKLRACIANEKEEDYRLSPEDRANLKKYPNALDYELSEEQLKFLEDNGYLVIPNFFSEEMMDKMNQQIFSRANELTGLVRDDISTWEPSGRFKVGYIDLWHLPAYYELRQDPRAYSIFSQILKEPRLTVSLDRVSFKTPAWAEVEKDGKVEKLDFSKHQRSLAVHTDMNLWYLQYPLYQGSICLEDCPIGNGGFTVMPGYHKLSKIRQYRVNFEKGLYHDEEPRQPPVQKDVFLFYKDQAAIDRDLIEVPMKRGDFLIWSSRLPHGNAMNVSNKWRIQCFVRYISADEDHTSMYRSDVRKSVETGLKPNIFSTGNSVPQQNKEWEVPYHKEVPLTELGKKLFGFEPWK